MSPQESEFQQDPALPPGWHAWETAPTHWHARPPGTPDPRKYIHGNSKQEVAEGAWQAHRASLNNA